MEISASYLNLIEANKRRINGALLSRIAEELDIRDDRLTGRDEARLIETLSEMAADPGLAVEGQSAFGETQEVVARNPNWSRLAARAYRRMTGLAEAVNLVEDRLANDPALGDAVHDMLTEISALRSTSEILFEGGKDGSGAMEAQQRERFEEILFQQSARLSDTGAALARYFDETTQKRRLRIPAAEAEEAIALTPALADWIEEEAKTARRYILREDEDIAYALRRATRDFDVDRDIGWLEERDRRALAFATSRFHGLVDRAVDACAAAHSAAWREIGEAVEMEDETRRLIGREVLRRAADALLAPKDFILAEAADCGWDLMRLQRRLDGDMALVMRRIACLPSPGDGGANARAAHFRVDAAGRTLERRGALQLAPRGRNLDCPVWPAHRAARGELLVLPVMRHDEGRALAIAWTDLGGMWADMLLLGESAARDGVYAPDLEKAPALVGGECRVCAHQGCRWRREPFVAGSPAED